MRRPFLLSIALSAAAGCGKDFYDLDGGDQITVGAAFVKQHGVLSGHLESMCPPLKPRPPFDMSAAPPDDLALPAGDGSA